MWGEVGEQTSKGWEKIRIPKKEELIIFRFSSDFKKLLSKKRSIYIFFMKSI